MKRNIPNLITLLNVFCGSCALVCIFYGNALWVFIWLFLAGLADFADGLVARALKIHSPLGKELDSLADMISFGLVPGMMFFSILGGTQIEGPLTSNWLAFSGFILTAFSCLRLAKFNIDERQTSDFIGLATPSVTMFTTGLYLIHHYNSFGWRTLIGNPYILIPIILMLSYLLVSEIRMFSFKFKSMQWKDNEFKYLLMIAAIVQIVFLQEAAFSFIILTYIVFALLENRRRANA